jgi:Peptidase A4 family
MLWAVSAMVSCSSLIAVGSAPDAGRLVDTAAPATVSGAFLPGPGHPHIHAAPDVSVTNSTNWSGYAQVAGTDRTFTEVTDTMVVPTVVAHVGGAQFAADWVGIGGTRGDPTLVQDGIQAAVSTNKKKKSTSVIYDAWTEILPQPEKRLPLTVTAGDTVTATVLEIARNKWKMTIDDITTGVSDSRTVRYHSEGLSAEAIHERPCVRGNCESERDLAILADTSDVIFGPGSFSESRPGVTPVPEPLLGPANDAGLSEFLMVSSVGETLAVPSGPSADNDAFAVSYGNIPSPPPTI